MVFRSELIQLDEFNSRKFPVGFGCENEQVSRGFLKEFHFSVVTIFSFFVDLELEPLQRTHPPPAPAHPLKKCAIGFFIVQKEIAYPQQILR